MTSDDKPIDARITFNVRGSFKTGSDGVFQFCAHRLAGGDTLKLSARIDDGSPSGRVVDVTREITEALTVIPVKIGAAPPVMKRP